ncbi:RNA-directed DNA polymerase, eukaryota, reverse transcriptase zinc-binding domain protein [Tanacetum coccineum]
MSSSSSPSPPAAVAMTAAASPLWFGSLKSKTVSEEDVEIMIMNVSDMEIKEALFDICNNKALVLMATQFNSLRVPGMIKSALFKLVSPCQSAFIPERTATFTISINIDRAGYFKGGRGLRQGDLISHYIFTLVMEVFTLILQKQISEDPKFKYHWGCKDLQISHLCFADDLLVLCHGDLNSVKVVKRALDMFSSISSLNPNIGKSTVFFGNVKEQDKIDILATLPFKIGSLPVSYLGVPLITKHLTFTDCKGLIDKVKIKVNDWKNKLLSYASRLQLIASILSSMQVYWASVFILPKSVIMDINKLLKGFLWYQENLSKGKAKVAWKQVYKSKDEGCLGIKDLSTCNEVLMAKHLWNVASRKESLWVKWINKVRLKWCSIWEVETDVNSSHGRLSTQERLMKWYPEKQLRCSLCGTCPDSLNHLFFECQYSNKIWSLMKKKSSSEALPDKWEDILATMTQLKHNRSIKSVLRRIIISACVYFIWNERNKRLFTNDKRDSNDLSTDLVNYIRLKLACLKIKRTNQIEEVCKTWKVDLNVKSDGTLMESIDKDQD